MTLREKIESKNLEIQSILFNEKDTCVIKINIPKKLQELIGLIKSIESNNREFKNWVKDNSIFYLEESIMNCKKCYNPSKVNTITSLFLKSTIEKCKQLSVEAIKNLYVTAEFFEVSIASHEKAETATIAIL
jgi:hypothetical protein